MVQIRNGSEAAVLEQMEQDLSNIVITKAQLANSELSKYSAYISEFAAYIQDLYMNPQNYSSREVLPPDAANAGTFFMQRYLATEEIAYEDVAEEIALLGNLESMWAPVVNGNSDMISTIYVGTTSGFHISYDPRSDLGVMEGSYESYYDYFDSTWYTQAETAKEPFFTEIYMDSYGRGLTISCAAPFYDENGEFAGSVCMDILIADLKNELIELVDMDEGSYAFLVDQSGNVFASPYTTVDQMSYENILDTSHPANEYAGDILSGLTDVSLTSGGIYYAYSPISSTGWSLCMYLPESVVLKHVATIDQSIFTSLMVFLTAFAVIILVVVLLVRSFSRQLTAPLIALSEDIEIISSGDLNHRAEMPTVNDEIGDLTQGFNNMAISLQQYISDLTNVTAEKERIGAELDVATHIQMSMLPCIFPAFPQRSEFDIFATMTPAKEVGGDFFDFFMVDDRHLAIVMADVSGKGVPAALFMVIGKTLIKDHTQPDLDLGTVFSTVNDLLCEANSEGLFITAFEGVLDLVTGEFRFVNAGHEPPFISRSGGEFCLHKIRPGFVLAGMEGMRYRAESITLEPGDKIFQYTDGVTEATNSEHQLYGMDRLKEVLCCNADKNPHDILPAVKADIDLFVGSAPQFDDITMLCLEYKSRMTPDSEVEL